MGTSAPTPLNNRKYLSANMPEDDDTGRPRKRARYTRIACETCKTRKVKCSGNLPCHRCFELKVDCKYNRYSPQPASEDISSPSQQDTKKETAESIQHNLDQLLSRMTKVWDKIEQSTSQFGLVPLHGRSLKRSRPHSYITNHEQPLYPTNFVDSLNLARSVLEERGILSTSDCNQDHQPTITDSSQPTDATIVVLQSARPVLDVGHEKVRQYITSFIREVYPIYPCIDAELAIKEVDALFAMASPAAQHRIGEIEVDLIDVDIMKAVLAISMLTQGNDQCSLSSDLEGQLLWSVDGSINQERPQIEDITVATLLSIYCELKGRVVKAWRMVGLAARSCLELGMHRKSFYERQNCDANEARKLKRVFCCIYNLDKMCSLRANLPWTLHDSDIDDSVLSLEPQNSFLSVMISMNRFLPEIFDLTGSPPDSKPAEERAEYLDFRIQKLVESLPVGDFDPLDPGTATPPWLQSVMKTFFQLRMSRLRMIIHMRALSSPQAISSQPRSIRALISLAKRSVDLHTETMAAGGVGCLLCRTVDKFLMSSMSCMFLAASYNPSDYGPICRSAFHRAIDMLNRSSSPLNEPHSKAWCTLDDLRRIAEKLQMPTPEQSPAGMSGEESSENTVDIRRQLFEEDFFGSFDASEHGSLGIFGGASPKNSYLSTMDSIFDYMPQSTDTHG